LSKVDTPIFRVNNVDEEYAILSRVLCPICESSMALEVQEAIPGDNRIKGDKFKIICTNKFCGNRLELIFYLPANYDAIAELKRVLSTMTTEKHSEPNGDSQENLSVVPTKIDGGSFEVVGDLSCHRCDQKIEIGWICGQCKRLICCSCHDEFAGMCVDCANDLANDPERFWGIMNKARFLEVIQIDDEAECAYDFCDVLTSDFSIDDDFDYDDCEEKANPFSEEEGGLEEYSIQEIEYWGDVRAKDEKCKQDDLDTLANFSESYMKSNLTKNGLEQIKTN
jgi:hypothetical protein